MPKQAPLERGYGRSELMKKKFVRGELFNSKVDYKEL